MTGFSDARGPAAVSVEIGTLRIIGFSRAEARRVEDGFRQELARLSAEDLSGEARQSDRILAQAEGRGTPELTGAAAARAVIAGLDR